jgi:hypothetical protein
MTPEERHLLERALDLSEDNNRILKKLERKARWAFIWGIVKIAVIIVPLVAGYLLLEPYLNQAFESYKTLQTLI